MVSPFDLGEQNPWWQKVQNIQSDNEILKYEKSTIKWEPRIKHKFSFGDDAVYTLRGPRQVGKTTLIKLIIKELLDSGVSPQNIFYYSCELIENPKQMVDIVKLYLDLFHKKKKSRIMIFLDEVSSVRNWQKALQSLVDHGTLRGCTVILLGSHSLDIKSSSERLPGRRGLTYDTLDKILMPMKFSEYAETINDKIKDFIRENLLDLGSRTEALRELAKGNIPTVITEMSPLGNALNNLLDQYAITGGMPTVANLLMETRSFPTSVFKTYVDAVLGDFSKWNKRETYVRQLVRRITETLGTPVGWNTLKQNTDISHHEIVSEYIDALKDSFVLAYVYRLSPHGGPDYQKNKKVYFHDPFIFHSLRSWARGTDPNQDMQAYLNESENKGKLVEGIVCDHLIRLLFSTSGQKQMFDYETCLFHWSDGNRERKEVDFALKLGTMYYPIEVKFQRSIGKADTSGLLHFIANNRSLKGLLLSRDLVQVRRSYVILPTALFLMLI